MRPEEEDHFGKIKMIDIGKGFGFIYSEFDREEYYFKVYSIIGDIELNNEVAFKLKLRNGKIVADAIRKVYSNKVGLKFVARVNGTHLHIGTEKFLQAAYEQILSVPPGKSVRVFEFPEVIGKTICLPTSNDDRIFYAIREGRTGHSRFVFGKIPVESNLLTIVSLNLLSYNLICSCFIGDKARPEPWDKDATIDDLTFWQDHAFIFGEEKIIDGSETEICPWILNEPAISHVKIKPVTSYNNKIW